MEQRPLDLGGVFNRAATLYARAFVPFAGLVAVTTIPLAVVQYVVTVREQPELDAALKILEHPQPNAHLPALLTSPVSIALTVASILFGYVMMAFAFSAVAAGVARVYRSETVAFRACYQAVFSRWPAILALLCLVLLALSAAYLAAVAVAVIPVSLIALVAPIWALMIVPFAATAMLIALVFVLTMLLLIGACGFCGIVIEGCSAPESLRLAFAMVWNRRELGRALLCSMAVNAIALAGSIFVDLFAVLGLAQVPAAYVSVDAVVRTVVLPFVSVVLTIYYLDLRLRGEHAGLHTPVYAPTKYLSGRERELVAEFLERRDRLTVQRRRAVAAQLAVPVRERVPPELARMDDESLLERL